MTYYAIYAGLLMATFLGRSERNFRSMFYWLVLFGLFLFSGLRFEVGCDWSQYLRHFQFGALMNYEAAFALREPGHWSLIRLLNDIGLPYQWLNIATSAIFFFGLHVLARRQPDPLAFLVLCFPILIINMPMSGIRQGAAIGFMFLAYVSILDRRLLFFIFWIMLGSTFHVSILAFLLLAPFVRAQFNRRTVLLSAIFAVPAAYGLYQTEAAEEAASSYIGTGVDAAGAVFRLAILSLSGAFFLRILAPAWRRQFPGDYKLAMIGAVMMVGIFPLLFVSSVIGDRFGYYLIPIQAMIFARIPYLKLGGMTQIYTIVPYAVVTIVFIAWMQLSWHFNQCYIPYQFGFG